MKILSITLLIIFAALPSYAGDQIEIDVRILNNVAYGGLNAAASNGTNQYIGCSSRFGAAGISGYCSARDEAGNFISCYTSNYTLAMIAGNLGGRSGYLYFIRNTSGECTTITVASNSRYL